MNLADAIRQAAQNGSSPFPEPEEPIRIVASQAPPAPEEMARDAVTLEPVKVPDAPIGPSAGGVVRMELFLSPEQMSGLFRAIVGTQHSVMTSREAAAYLRINQASLEAMAAEGKIPAFNIEGRWRFPKNSVDEWLTLQTFRKEEIQDVA